MSLLQALLPRFGILGERLLAFDIGGDLRAPARILLARSGDALLFLGQLLVLDAQPMQSAAARSASCRRRSGRTAAASA